MKKIFKIGLPVAVASLLLVGCLKDTPITDYSDQAIKPVVLIPNGNHPRTQSATPLALDFSATPYEVRVYARVSWDKPLGKSVDVTFKEDAAAIDAYNTKFGSDWEKMNSTAYSVPSLKITIPAGQQEAYIPVMVFPDKVDLSKNNILAFTITDASGEVVSSNYQTILVPILIKNIYEANYTVTGYFFHPTGPRAISATKYFATVNGNRVEGQLGDLAGWGIRFDINGTVLSNFESSGATPPPPQANFMTADNPGAIAYPGPAFPGTAPWVQTTYNNTYDPATKTFWLHYGYHVGGNGQNSYTRNIYEKWVRK